MTIFPPLQRHRRVRVRIRQTAAESSGSALQVPYTTQILVFIARAVAYFERGEYDDDAAAFKAF